MAVSTRQAALIILLVAASSAVYAQTASVSVSPDSGTASSRQMKDQVRDMTFSTRIRNPEFDQWKYITDLREEFQGEVDILQGRHALVKQVLDYCVSDADSYTCRNQDQITDVDTHLAAAIRDWQNAVLILIDIEKNRTGGQAENSQTQELQRINVLMNDIHRFNERAKEHYQQAQKSMIEFQDSNPLLFTEGEN